MPDAPFSSAMHAAMAALRSAIAAGLGRTCKHQRMVVDGAAIERASWVHILLIWKNKLWKMHEVSTMVGNACRYCEGTAVSTDVQKHDDVDVAEVSGLSVS